MVALFIVTLPTLLRRLVHHVSCLDSVSVSVRGEEAIHRFERDSGSRSIICSEFDAKASSSAYAGLLVLFRVALAIRFDQGQHVRLRHFPGRSLSITTTRPAPLLLHYVTRPNAASESLCDR